MPADQDDVEADVLGHGVGRVVLQNALARIAPELTTAAVSGCLFGFSRSMWEHVKIRTPHLANGETNRNPPWGRKHSLVTYNSKMRVPKPGYSLHPARVQSANPLVHHTVPALPQFPLVPHWQLLNLLTQAQAALRGSGRTVAGWTGMVAGMVALLSVCLPACLPSTQIRQPSAQGGGYSMSITINSGIFDHLKASFLATAVAIYLTPRSCLQAAATLHHQLLSE